MAEETTGGVNYGLLGPHSGTQFKPTSMKDVEQYMRDVREIKRTKAKERALQSLETGGIDAMKKSLMADGFAEMAEPMEREVAQARQTEVIGTVGNVLKMRQAEDAGFIPRGSTDRLFNSQQKEIIPPVDEFAPVSSQGSAITSKVGETEARIAPGSSMTPISPKYETVAPPAATKLTADLARMPYEGVKTEPESVQEYGFKFSAKTNPNFVYEPESARRILGLSANPNEETVSKYVREKAERETPVIDPMQFSDLSTMGDYRKAQNERKAKISQTEAKIYEDIRKNADILRQEELSNKSARQGLVGQELGIEAQKRESQKAEREKLNRTPWSPSNPTGNVFILPEFDTEKITDASMVKEIKDKAIIGKRLDTDYKVAQKAKFKGLGNMMSLAESAIKAQGISAPTITAKLEWANQMGWVPTREEQGQIERMMDRKSFSIWSDALNRTKGSFGLYGSPGDSTKIAEQLNPIFDEISAFGADINYDKKKQDAKSAVESKGVGAKKTDTPAPKSDKTPRKTGESLADYYKRIGGK